MPTITTTVTSAEASGVTTTVTTTEATPEAAASQAPSSSAGTIDASSAVTVINWPMQGRFGAQYLMMDHAGIKYTDKTEFEDIAGVTTAFGATGVGTVAPPVIIDGDLTISQSYAQNIYIGRKAGLETGTYCQFKATQMLADIDDWLLNNFKPGAQTLTSSEFLKTFMEGAAQDPKTPDTPPAKSRWAVFAEAIEFNISGPYTFGSEPTCVDFFLCNQLDMVHVTILQELADHSGIDYLKPYPKIAGVWAGIKGLDVHKKMMANTEKRPVMMSREWMEEAGAFYYPAAGVIENY